jgi:hypothetical protein
MNKTFKGDFVPFYLRLFKRLAPVILVFFFLGFKVTYSHTFDGFRNYFYVFMLVCLLIGIYFHTDKIRTIVNEVTFVDRKLEIVGQDFNSRYFDSLDLSKILLEIQLEELGKNKTRICLELYSADKYYYLNKFNDWDYATLAGVVDEFKLRTDKFVPGIELYSQLNNNQSK